MLSWLLAPSQPLLTKNEVFSVTYEDYTNKEKALEIHIDACKPGERILLIDDWVETGDTIKAAINLLERVGGVVIGVGTCMDDSQETLKHELSQYNYKYIEKVEKSDLF